MWGRFKGLVDTEDIMRTTMEACHDVAMTNMRLDGSTPLEIQSSFCLSYLSSSLGVRKSMPPEMEAEPDSRKANYHERILCQKSNIHMKVMMASEQRSQRRPTTEQRAYRTR